MTNVEKISGAKIISGSNVVSGSIVVQNPFILGVSGELGVCAKTEYGQVFIPASDIVIFGSDAKVRWAEKRK